MASSTCYREVRREWQGGGMHVTLCGKPLPCAEHNQRTYTQAELDAAVAAERARVVGIVAAKHDTFCAGNYTHHQARTAFGEVLHEITFAAARGTGGV